MPCALCPMPYALCPMPYALCPMPYTLCPMPYALCLMPCALCPIPYALCHMPYALYLMLYIMCPIADHLHPRCKAINLKPCLILLPTSNDSSLGTFMSTTRTAAALPRNVADAADKVGKGLQDAMVGEGTRCGLNLPTCHVCCEQRVEIVPNLPRVL